MLHILLPKFNYHCEKMLSSLYKDLQDEDLKLFDLTVLDDCSSKEDFRKIYFDEKPNLKFIQGKNHLGCGLSRNYLMEIFKECLEDYIWFIDADDEVIEMKELLKEVSTSKEDCLYVNFKCTSREVQVQEISKLDDLYKSNYGIWSKIFKAKFWVNDNFYRPEHLVSHYLMLDKYETVKTVSGVHYVYSTDSRNSPDAPSRILDVLSNTYMNLGAQYFSNARTAQSDEFISGILHNLAELYKLRPYIRHENLRKILDWKFQNMFVNISSGKFIY